MAEAINIKRTDFNELVFEERNKSYGAYVLRKKYADTILISLLIGIGVVGLAVAIPYIADLFPKPAEETYIPIDTFTTPPPVDENAEEILPPPPPPDAAPPQEQAKSVEFTTPVVTADNVEQITTTEEVKASNPGAVTQDGIEGFAALPEGDGQGKVAEIETNKVFTIVEVMPSFTGGQDALARFLQNNINYPQRAKEMNIEGKVYLSFVVDNFGNVGNVKVLRGIGGGCDEEAVRVVKKMPRWTPGKQGGRAVSVNFNLPIEFKLN